MRRPTGRAAVMTVVEKATAAMAMAAATGYPVVRAPTVLYRTTTNPRMRATRSAERVGDDEARDQADQDGGHEAPGPAGVRAGEGVGAHADNLGPRRCGLPLGGVGAA
jgi:hypothetical protein